MLLKTLVLITFLPFVVFSQTNLSKQFIQTFFYPEFDLNSLESEITDIEKEDLLVQLCFLRNHCDFCELDTTNFKAYLQEHKTSIFFIDLDQDGDQDIVFNGKECSGVETGIVEFYENKADTLIRHFKIEGKLINLNLKKHTYAIHDYPCCAQQSHYIVNYKYNKKTIKPEIENAVLFIGQSNLLGGPFFPPSFNKKKRLKLSKTTELRWSPNTTDQDPSETCLNNRTNSISVYPKGAKGTILYTNSNGWVFVKMNYYENAKNPCIYNSIPELGSSP